MTGPLKAQGFFAVDKDIVDRDEASLVCAVVMDVLRTDLTGAYVDAYSDYDNEMPDESPGRKDGRPSRHPPCLPQDHPSFESDDPDAPRPG